MLAKEELNLSARVLAVEVEDKAALQQQLAEAKAALQQQQAEQQAAQQQQAEQLAALQQRHHISRCELAESKGEHVGAGMYHIYRSSCYYISVSACYYICVLMLHYISSCYQRGQVL